MSSYHSPMESNSMHSSKTTEPLASSLHSHVSSTAAQIEPYKAGIETLLMLGLYLTYNGANVRYVKSPRRTQAAHFSYPLLTYHIAVGLLLAGRYYARHLLEPSRPVMPDRLDFALGLTHALSAWSLARTTHSCLPLAKASFQAVALLELAAALLAYTTESSQWLLTTVRIIDWFVTYRTTVRLIRKNNLFGFPKGSADGLTHLVSAPFTLWLSGYPWGIPLYYAVLGFLLSVESLVSQQVPDNAARRTTLTNLLIVVGLCEKRTTLPPPEPKTE